MERTKLLLCNHQSPPNFVGGAEFILLDIARSMDRDKFDIHLLANENGAFTRIALESGIRVATVPHDMLWDFLAPGKDISDRFERFKAAQRKSIKAIKKTIRENGIHALLVNCLVNIVPLMAAKECNIPAIWMIHEIVHAFDSMPGGLKKTLRNLSGNNRHKREGSLFIRQTMLDYCRLTVFVTETSRKKIFDPREWREKTAVLPPPVRREIFFAPQLATQSYPGIPDNAFSVVFLGILFPHKGVHDFIQAASQVIKVETGVHFTIAGGSSDRNYVRRLKKMASGKPLEDRIQFTGFLQNPLPLIDRADVICMPSLYEEPFGMVVTEGMTRGKVVVAYDTGSIREVIEDGKTGYLLPRGDIKALAGKICQLINNKDVMRSVGRRAAVTASRKFNPDDYISKLEDILGTTNAR